MYGLDFRDLRRVELFCTTFEQRHARIDIIINNACQTIRRPTAYYQPLLQNETVQKGMKIEIIDVLQSNRKFVESNGTRKSNTSPSMLLSNDDDAHDNQNNNQHLDDSQNGNQDDNETVGEKEQKEDAEFEAGETEIKINLNTITTPSVLQSQLIVHSEDNDSTVQKDLPTGAIDVNGQQLDLRKRNTWIMKMEEIETPELAEVFAINSIAPFILNSRLTPLMKRSNHPNNNTNNTR